MKFFNGPRIVSGTLQADGDVKFTNLSYANENTVLVVAEDGKISTQNLDFSNVRTGTVSTSHGGTGLTSIGSANQILSVNGAGTALEWVSSGGTIDWTQDQGSTNIHANNYNNTQLSQEEVEDFAGAMFNSNSTTGPISSTYNDSTGKVDLTSTALPIAGGTMTGALEISSSSITDYLKLTTSGSDANPVKLIFEKTGSEQGVIEYNRNGDLEIYNTDSDGGVMISGSASADPDVYVNHAGNVGIGTNSPGQKITLNEGYINVTGAGTSHGYMLSRDSLDTYRIRHLDGGLTIQNSTDDRKEMTFDGAGNVGIGTTAPEEKLTVNGSIQLPNQQDIVWADIGDGNTARVAIRGNEDNDTILFKTDNLERMRLTNTGLGIGTSTPSARLHLSGSDSAASALRQSREGVKIWDQAIDSSGRLQWGYRSSEGGTRTVTFTLDDNNNVGIGTATPSEALTVSGNISTTGDIFANNINLTDSGGGNMIILDSSSGDGIIRWEDNNTQKWDIGRDNTDQAFVISNDGSLGDNQVLHLNHSTGHATFGAGLTVNGNITVSGTVDSRNIATDGEKLDGIDSGANNYTLPEASSSALGGIKVSSSVTNVVPNEITVTSGRGYSIQKNSNGVTSVNVPWTDNNTTYTLSAENGPTADKEIIRLSDNGEGTNDITLEAGNGLSIGRTGNTIKLDNTSSVVDATEGTKGKVELATVSEATAGTDTARATTPAGVKAHVDSKYSIQYINLHGQAIVGADEADVWFFPKDVGGIEYYKFEDVTDNVSIDSTSFTLPRASQHKGIHIPYTCKLVGFTAISSCSGNAQGKSALWYYQPRYGEGGSNGSSCIRSHYAEADLSISSGNSQTWEPTTNYSTRPAFMNAKGGETDNTDAEIDLNAGYALLPSITGASAGTHRVTFTIILKVPLQTAGSD